MGYRVKPFTMSVRNNSTQEFEDIGLLGSDVEAEISELDAKIDQEISDRQNADAALQEQISRKLLVISDSYADPNRGGFNHGFYGVMISQLGLTDNVDAFIYQIGGAGFVGASQGKTFSDLLEDAISAMTEDERSEITDIFVCGGANDQDGSITVQAINTAKDTFYSRARSQFPNAWINYAMISGFLDFSSRFNLLTKVQYVYYYSPAYKLNFITNAHLPMSLTDSFAGSGDTVHPNSLGCQRIGWLLASAFRSKGTTGEFCSRGARQQVTGTVVSGITASDGDPKFRVYSDGTSIQMVSVTPWHFSGSFSITFNNGFTVDLFTFPLSDGGFVGNNSSNTHKSDLGAIPAVAEAYVSSSDSVIMEGLLNFVYDSTNQNMKVGFCTRTAPKSATATTLRIKPFNFTTIY